MSIQEMSNVATQAPAAAGPQAPAPPAAGKTKRGKGTKGGKKGKRNKNKAAQPSRCKVPSDMGIYITPSRCRWHLDSAGMNAAIERAINELQAAEPHPTDPEKKDSPMTKLIPLEQCSTETQQLVQLANKTLDEKEAKDEKKAEARQKKDAEAVKAGRLDLKQRDADKKQKDEARAKKLADEKAKKEADRKQRDADLEAKGLTVKPRKVVPRGTKRETPHAESIENLSKIKIRFAKETHLHVAAVACTLTHELMQFGIDTAVAKGRKILKTRHLLDDGVRSLSLSSLYVSRPVYKAAREAEAKRLKDDEKRREERAAAKKEAAKDGKEVVKVEKKAVEDEDEDDDEEDLDNRSFRHYIKNVCHNYINLRVAGKFIPRGKTTPLVLSDSAEEDKRRAAYAAVKISKEALEFGSQIVADFIAMLCPLLRGQIDSMSVKTVSEGVVHTVIAFLLTLVNGDVQGLTTHLNEKIKQWKDYQKRRADEEQAEEIRKATAAKAAASQPASQPAPQAAAPPVANGTATATPAAAKA